MNCESCMYFDGGVCYYAPGDPVQANGEKGCSKWWPADGSLVRCETCFWCEKRRCTRNGPPAQMIDYRWRCAGWRYGG